MFKAKTILFHLWSHSRTLEQVLAFSLNGYLFSEQFLIFPAIYMDDSIAQTTSSKALSIALGHFQYIPKINWSGDMFYMFQT